jgi:hypothetical protein
MALPMSGGDGELLRNNRELRGLVEQLQTEINHVNRTNKRQKMQIEALKLEMAKDAMLLKKLDGIIAQEADLEDTINFASFREFIEFYEENFAALQHEVRRRGCSRCRRLFLK